MYEILKQWTLPFLAQYDLNVGVKLPHYGVILLDLTIRRGAP